LVESIGLPRLRKDDKQSVNLFIWARPPGASSRRIAPKFMFGVIGENRPGTCFLSSLVKCSLPELLCQCRPHRETAETLNPPFALFEV
jgi:hypothetical protein